MPKALVINPNTSQSMTAEIERTAQRVFSPPGPVSFQPHQPGPSRSNSGVITPWPVSPSCRCWLNIRMWMVSSWLVLGTPGLYALKEQCDKPVVGIAEASMSMALLIGNRFGILAGMRAPWN